MVIHWNKFLQAGIPAFLSKYSVSLVILSMKLVFTN
ncbi:hypothetical protein BPA_0900013 (plasmid) [Borrelia parkeri SLO]|uniref:Uncharacterized protein n=1 Tax=Borrelia parkeri SLO TaxID=1313294 RepID=W5SSS1_BORPR|nr:hypothetical protein BPA_0900013 [Borrelia parkeri SLO]